MNLNNKQLALAAYDIDQSFNIEEIKKSIDINLKNQCPRCKGQSINKNGKTKLKRQRYLCKSCGKSFSETTGSPLSYSKKTIDKWFSYICCMKKRLSLRESAKALKINLVTSFYWRHKILSVIGTKIIDKKLCDTIEVHELKIKENFKGNNRKRSSLCLGNEFSSYYDAEYMQNRRDVVSILSCKDTHETILFKAVVKGRITRQVLDRALAPAIRNGKILGTSRNINYVNFAKTNKMKLCMVGSGTYLVKGIDIKRAKEQSRDFKKFLKIYRGVASKYLSYYINWFRLWIENAQNISFHMLSYFITGERQLRTYDFQWVQFDGNLVKSEFSNRVMTP